MPKGKPPAKPIAPRWKPGESGNPSGRPKTKPFTDELKRQLAEWNPEDPAKRTRLQRIVTAWLDAAELEFSYNHLREMIERTEGKTRDDGDPDAVHPLIAAMVAVLNRNADPPPNPKAKPKPKGRGQA